MAKKKQQENLGSGFRSRIIGLENVSAKQLVAHEMNPRKHPAEQKEAITAALKEIGYADAIIARKVGDNKYQILDGHLRAEISGEEKVPVILVDLDDDEAKKFLSTHDAITNMANTDGNILDALTKDLEFKEYDLQNLVDSMSEIDLDDEDESKPQPIGEKVPELDLRPNEHYDYLIVMATNRQDWNRLCFLLDVKRVKGTGRKATKVGIGRGIHAVKLIERLENAKAQNNNSK